MNKYKYPILSIEDLLFLFEIGKRSKKKKKFNKSNERDRTILNRLNRLINQTLILQAK